jgi:hypothetical protein
MSDSAGDDALSDAERKSGWFALKTLLYPLLFCHASAIVPYTVRDRTTNAHPAR